MTLIRDFAQNIKSDGDLVISGDFRGPRSITSGGDILGSNFQLTGTTSNSNSKLRSILLASAPEHEHVVHPYLLNDLATFRPRGGTVNISGLNVGVTDSGITNMFRPNARFLTFNGSDYSGTEVTITLTDIPAALTYAAYFGMVFGAAAFKPQSAKIEVSTDGGSNWTVILNSSASDTHYHSYYGGNNNQVNAIRYTIGQPANTQIRIINLYAYNYSSLGMDGYFLPRDGGEIFGNIGIAETPSDFGSGYSLRIGNATKGGSLVLRSHDPGNSGLLQFVHKDGLSAMQLGSSTDTAPSPDKIYGYIYNYNNDFRIQGDNGTHLIIDGNGTATFADSIFANDIFFSSVAPISFTSQGNTGTYNRSVIYGPQNNTSGNTANGIFIERGRLTDAFDAEVRHLVIGSRGGEAQVTIDGVGNTTFAGDVTFSGNKFFTQSTDNLPTGKNLDIWIQPDGDTTHQWRIISGGTNTGYGTGDGGLGFYYNNNSNYNLILYPNMSCYFPSGANFNTSTNAKPLQISRGGAIDNQVLNIGILDTQAVFNYIEDTSGEGAGNYGSYTFQVSGNSSPTGPVTVLSMSQTNANFSGTLSNTGAHTITNGALKLSQAYNVEWGSGYNSGDPALWGNTVDKALRFAPDGTTTGMIVEINTSGITMSNGAGIVFRDTGVASNPATANESNTLTDYETGTWSPKIEDYPNGVEVTYNTLRGGQYTRIGTLVNLQFTVGWTSSNGGTGQIAISNLPFARSYSSDPQKGQSTLYIGYNNGLSYTGPGLGGYVTNNSKFLLRQWTTAGGVSSVTMVNSCGELICSATYHTT